ncbi:MAG: hypothetical protein COA96_12680 [SAR86 cluster bacterium]|uniref:Uncharacterized protein n=1 Tax=SAR86 cluster bacterium TaxID=2030880 RepID=A0A2A5AV91_9GAMM|nr:MAG: hypothetical protein COA96_12680 [SAR86 cluster bacterium]
MPVEKASGKVKLISCLLIAQFLSMIYVSASIIFDVDNSIISYAIILLVSSIGLFLLKNRQGTPILLKKQKHKKQLTSN